MNIINQKWLRIFVFYLIALVFSFFFRIAPPVWYENLYLPYGLSIYKSWLGGMGPFLGALLVTWIFRPPRRNSLFGTSKAKSALMMIIPIVLFSIIGASNNEGLDVHFYGFQVGFILMVYCILEETGWRGYLQDELRGMNPALKYFIIGTLWYAWHLSFWGGNVNISTQLILLAVLVVGSWGIGQAVEATQSIIVGACFHSVGNIMAFSSLVKSTIQFNERLIIIGISILIWIVIMTVWDRKIPNLEKKEKMDDA